MYCDPPDLAPQESSSWTSPSPVLLVHFNVGYTIIIIVLLQLCIDLPQLGSIFLIKSLLNLSWFLNVYSVLQLACMLYVLLLRLTYLLYVYLSFESI